MTKIEEAVAELEQEVEVMDEVVPAIIKIVDKYADDNLANADEPDKIRAGARAFKAKAADLAAAVARHTPAEPPVA